MFAALCSEIDEHRVKAHTKFYLPLLMYGEGGRWRNIETLIYLLLETAQCHGIVFYLGRGLAMDFIMLIVKAAYIQSSS